MAEFRDRYESALQDFGNSREIGKAAQTALRQAQKKMDQNHDGAVSDQEIFDFLQTKLAAYGTRD
ncbi:MAG TPA: hypothetical protein VFG11_09605 [Acidobacteriota bacterium]|nr:hypothetical protein [Acidobacteriota bacterium]